MSIYIVAVNIFLHLLFLTIFVVQLCLVFPFVPHFPAERPEMKEGKVLRGKERKKAAENNKGRCK